MQTTQDLRNGLSSDPDFALHFILDNNMPAVITKLQDMNFTVGDYTGAEEALHHLRTEKPDLFLAALNVPMLTDGIDMAEYTIAADVARAHQRTGGKGKSADTPITPQNVFEGIAQGIMTMYGNKPADSTTPSSSASDVAAARASASAAEAKAQKTTIIVVVVSLVVVIAIVLVFTLKKKKAA